jgi:soluble lytic murein transglycosylase-like protein
MKVIGRRTALALCAATATFAATAQAQIIDLSRVGPPPRPASAPNEAQAPWRDIIAAFDSQDWEKLRILLATQPETPLKGFVLAEFYTAQTSPKIELPEIEEWLSRYAHLPQAEQILRLGQRRGLTATYALPARNTTTRVAGITKRMRPRSVDDGTMPPEIAAAIQEAIKNDDPDSARLLLDGIDANLSGEARAEWRQRVAWSYYIENRDSAALALSRLAREGSGPWVAESDWTLGLAAWRLGDCATALEGFTRTARGAADSELRTAAHYWAARATLRCRRPGEAPAHLKAAARDDETLYGMLAREQLGQPLPTNHSVAPLSSQDWRQIGGRTNVQLATKLSELGKDVWASQALQHEVLTGNPAHFPALARLARQLNLPRTQMWMATNVPRSAKADPALRYPTTTWTPSEGWRVDPALAFAHALQESNFAAAAVSPANAIGLMQVRPIAARDVEGRTQLNAAYADLKDPATNLTFGQRNLEKLSEAGATRGHLPKVMAAYNAGLTPVTRWNSEVRDMGDPLLYMESIPFWETRSYVAIVMRNYWMYLRQRQDTAPSRTDLAQNRWPAFPVEQRATSTR